MNNQTSLILFLLVLCGCQESFRRMQIEEDLIKLEVSETPNADDLGMWHITYYVDDFNQPTEEGYITNANRIRGVFSNTATQNSQLDVRFLISDSSDISIKLFEYAGNNPVKAHSPENYTVSIQEDSGNRINLKAVNSFDRLSLNEEDSELLHRVFQRGGTVHFLIKEDDIPTTQYYFIIENSDQYGAAYKELIK